MDGFDFLEEPSEAYKELQGGYGKAEGLRVLEKHELPVGVGVTFGTKYRTWSLNSPVYLAFLLRKFRLKGGKTMKRELHRAEEAFETADGVGVVVNCSGFGFGDDNVYPIRGEMDALLTYFQIDAHWTDKNMC
jgi:D-amino-acid oxidase